MNQRILLAVLAAGAAAAIGALMVMNTPNKPGDIHQSAGLSPKSAADLADLGGPFTLTDHNGKSVSDKDYHGKFVLLYFGYTFCPDVCPTELNTVALAMEALGPLAEQVTPLFISVDPPRDTPARLKEFVNVFHPRMVGLTGTMEQVTTAAKAYRAYFRKEDNGDPDYYMIDHTAKTYLLGPDGQYLTYYAYQTPPAEMAASVRSYIEHAQDKKDDSRPAS